MKKEIENRDDVETMLLAFYKKAFEDEVIGHFFTTVVPLNIETHLPLITEFWMSVLFNTGYYSKNVMEVHTHINSLSPIKKEHLDRWIKLFTETVDQFFVGDAAALAKQRALSVATLMHIKLHNHNHINK